MDAYKGRESLFEQPPITEALSLLSQELIHLSHPDLRLPHAPELIQLSLLPPTLDLLQSSRKLGVSSPLHQKVVQSVLLDLLLLRSYDLVDDKVPLPAPEGLS